MKSIKKQLNSLVSQGVALKEKYGEKVDAFRQDIFRTFELDGYTFLITLTGDGLNSPLVLVPTILDDNFSQIRVNLSSSDLKMVNAYVKVLNLIASGKIPEADEELTTKTIQVMESRYCSSGN